jgi:hypothetical protein
MMSRQLDMSALTAATSVLAARCLEAKDFRRVAQFYVDLAGSHLRKSLSGDYGSFFHSVDDVIVSNLLAWLGYSGFGSEEGNAAYYFRLAYSLVCGDRTPGHHTYRPRLLDTENSDAKIAFYFTLDCANAWVTRNGGIPPRLTTFDQRVQYFDSFIPRLLARDAGESFSKILEAANSTLGNLKEVALSWTCRFSKSEFTGGVDRAQLEQVLLYIRSELGDRDLHAALQTLYQSFQGANANHTTVEGQLITRLFHRLRSVLFLHAVLSAPSIAEGFQHPDVALIAKKIVFFCHKQVIRRGGPIEDYFLLSWHNFSYLLLGGTGLRNADCPHTGMDLWWKMLMLVRQWVVNELIFIGREECAIALEAYWNNGGLEELIQILEFAQFPKPLEDNAWIT